MTRLLNADLPKKLLDQMEGPRPPDDFISDGLTNAPDFVGGVDCRPAGHFHDYRYWLIGSEIEREAGDYEFFRNLRTCGLSKFLAGVEFRRVRLLGIDHFSYHDPPKGWSLLRLRIRCFFSRYIRW